MRGIARALLALFAGALAVPAFAPVGWFPLAFLSLALLVGLLERADSARAGFCLGLAWGMGAFCAGVSWLVIALSRYGGVFLPVAVLVVFLFCAFLSLYPALAGAFYARWRRGSTLRRALFFAGLWVLVEWLRGTLFTGFPWLAIGYSQTPPSPVAGYFPIMGVYGLGGVLAFVAGLLGICATDQAGARAVGRWRVPAVLIALICIGGWGLSRLQWVEPDGEPFTVSLVQTNIEQSLKWDPDFFDETLRINADLVHAARGDVVVLPEAALPTMLDRLPESYLDMLTGFVRERNGALVIGVFTRDGTQYSNSAVTFGEGAGQRYSKSHLVPFGEYSPPFFGWFYRLASIPMAQQTPGAANQPPLWLFGRKIAVNICYEDVFGAELVSSLPQAGLMLNLSNLAWYGDSFAQPQHLQIARARAMETGRPMLRSTNTGMTALVLPDGSVPAALPAFTRGVLEVEVSAYKGLTPYARWGDAPVLVVALIGIVAGVGIRRREKLPVFAGEGGLQDTIRDPRRLESVLDAIDET
ncbi:MAG: apolipoprotein N-acyltransferase [Betaproteobacteria bacterium]|nr:apolipoprotein N-acyltransferase [Betaproteobacteria bacterium]